MAKTRRDRTSTPTLHFGARFSSFSRLRRQMQPEIFHGESLYLTALFRLSLLSLVIVSVSGCGSARPPVPPGEIPAGRAPTIEEEQYGHAVLQDLLEQYSLDTNDADAARIETVVQRLTQSIGLSQDPWQISLFDAPTVKNAAATRGNRIFVWSGMLREVQSDDELAAILAHEIAHVIARHTDPDPHEQARQILVSVGALAASVAVAATVGGQFAGDLGNLAGSMTQSVGEGIIVNPFSQELEHEADQIGLMIMSQAKYDPEAAIGFWKRVQQNPEFSASIPFLSTHPSSESRVARLQEVLPLALARYRGETVTQPLPERSATERSSALPPGADSFDLSGRSIEDLQRRIVSQRAIVYSKPSEGSRKLGEFPHGATVRILSEDRGWLQVDGPDRGYIRSRDTERSPR